jgi:hypothetical protein
MGTVRGRGSVAIGSRASVILTTRAALWRRHGWLGPPIGSTGCSPAISTPNSRRLPSGWMRAGAAGQGRGFLSGRISELRSAESIRAPDPHRACEEYPDRMNESSSRSLGRTIVAGLILLVAAWLLLHFVIGIVTAIASILVVVLAIVAIVWALRVLL